MGRGRSRSRRFWVGLLSGIIAMACPATWAATWHRRAWGGAAWPRFACLDQGRLMLFSTLWRPDGQGRWAWLDATWVYDVHGAAIDAGSRSRPDYIRIGDTYPAAATPAYTADIHAVTIPAWLLAIPFGLVSVTQLRRAGRETRAGCCPACGYSQAGLPTAGPCPECGAETRGPEHGHRHRRGGA